MTEQMLKLMQKFVMGQVGVRRFLFSKSSLTKREHVVTYIFEKGSCCKTDSLDNSGNNDFEEGQTDIFSGQNLLAGCSKVSKGLI